MSLNTTPRTWVTGEVIPAATMNAEVRDALTGIQAAWTSYTPVLGNWTLGNGTITGEYMQIGKTIYWHVLYTAGSTSTWAGNVTVTLPTVSARTTARGVRGYLHINDVSVPASTFGFAGQGASNNIVNLFTTTAGVVNATVPQTWAAGDTFEINGSYEAP